jgi:hypothetical protein
MNEAQELIRIVESRGGRLTIEGEKLVIEPQSAALPLADSLRTYKPEIVALLQSRTEQEAESAPESDALGLWMLARCVYRQGYEDSAGISCLWIDFCEWAVTADSVPCTRRTFERLLADAGFRCADGMAAGLLLRVDLEAVLCFQNPHREPAPQRTRKASR